MEEIRAFSRKGPLWKSSRVEINRLRDLARDTPGFDDADGLLKTLLREHMEYYVSHSSQQRVLGFEVASVTQKLLTDPLVISLFSRWDDSVYLQLIEKFQDTAPEDFIRKVIDYDKIRQYYNYQDIPAEYTCSQLFDFEIAMRRVIKEIPLGVDYEKKMYNAIMLLPEIPKLVKIVRLNTIADLLGSYNPDGLPIFREEISRQFMYAFRRFSKIDDFQSQRYADWYRLTSIIVLSDDNARSALTELWPPPSSELDPKLQSVVELCGAILADFYGHFPDHIAEDLVIPIIHGVLKQANPTTLNLEQGLRKWLWGVALNVANGEYLLPVQIATGLAWARDQAARWLLGNGVVDAIVAACSTIAISAYQFFDRFAELLLNLVEPWFENNYETLIEYFYLNRLFLSSVLPEARRRPKAVWALLFTTDYVKLTPAEKFLMGCATMQDPKPIQDYAAWAETRLLALKQHGVDLITEPAIPIRRFKIPDYPYVADEDAALLAPLMPNTTKVNQIASDFVKRLLDSGVPRGMDGMWFATPERIAQSIARYTIEIPPEEDIVRTATLRAAHALAEQFPEMYTQAKALTPEWAAKKIKVNNYSPGLPFIPRYRSRKQLQQLGIWDAVVREATNLIQKGVHPQEAAHVFVKSQVVKHDGLISGDKDIRTVTAATLLSNIIQYVGTVEVTRRQPPPDAFIMNAVPRSEGGFRMFYDKLKEFGHVFAADITKFDSQLIPCVIDAVVELRQLGYDGNLVKSKTDAIIRASYMAMKYAKLVDLETGIVFDKIKGFLTGQGNTSVDNRDAFRIVIIAAWSIKTGLPCSDFWKTNVIGNAGDDDAIGTDTPEIWPDIMEIIKRSFGMEIRLENEGFHNLELVGLTVGDVPAKSIPYYSVAGLAVPPYAIMLNTKALLHKRTEWVMRRSAAPGDISFLMKHLDGVIGTAYQTAHLIDVYKLLADEYLIETQQILLRFYDKVVVEKTLDAEGALISVFVHLGSERQRYVGKTANIRAWLKEHRFPTYADIMRIWLKPQDIMNTKMAKDHRKLLTWNSPVPYSEVALYNLWRVRETLLRHVPSQIFRAPPEFKGADPTQSMRNPDYVVEKFTYLSLYYNLNKAIPRASLFRQRLRENPYGSACDPVGFLNWLTTDNNMQILLADDLEKYRGQMIAVTLVYWFYDTIAKFFSNVPLIGILYHLYALTTRDINRLYATLNYFYMLATGSSSAIISNMMPPDPYAWMKRSAVITTYLLPSSWYAYMFPGARALFSVVPSIVEAWVAADSIIGPRPFRSLYNSLDIPASWGDILGQMRPWLEQPNNLDTFLVIAPTGTGKSTAFIGALLYNKVTVGQIWVLCPTIVSRDIYTNQFIPPDMFQILTSGVVNDFSRRVKILTYGHARSRLPKEHQAGDLVIFDEMHKGEMEMLAAWFMFSSLRRIVVTATPTMFMPQIDRTFTVPGGRRFTVQVDVVNLSFPDLWPVIEGIDPSLLQRALIICPSQSVVNDIVMTLSRVSVVGHRLSSLEPNPSPNGVIVATTIVDTAVTIEPPPTVLIDLGLTLKIEYDFSGVMPKATPRIVPTSKAVATQRLGRVGRAGNSRAFVMSQSGTGPNEEPRVTPFGLLNDKDLSHNMLAHFKIALACASVQDYDNIFRFVRISPYVQHTSLNPHTIALMFYLFARMSDYQLGDQLHEEFLDLRISKSEHEILNILVEDVNSLGFGNLTLGDYSMALSLLEGGAMEVSVSNRFVPCSCLVIIDGIVTFCGDNLANRIAHFPSVEAPFALKPVNQRYWTTFTAVTTFQTGLLLYQRRRHQGDCALTNVQRVPSILTLGVGSYMETASVILTDVRGRYCDQRYMPTRKVQRIRINEELDLDYPYQQLKVSTRNQFNDWNAMTYDMTPCNVSDTIPDLVLASLIAGAYYDENIIIYGEVPPAILVASQKFGSPGLIVDFDYTWAVFSPSYIRGFAHGLAYHTTEGQGSEYFTLIPKRVVVPNRYFGQMPLVNEVFCVLNEEDVSLQMLVPRISDGRQVLV